MLYGLLERDALGNTEIEAKNSTGKWTMQDWNEFVSMMSTMRMPFKGHMSNGRIFVTELQSHALHQICTAEFRGPFVVRDLAAAGGLFCTIGTVPYRFGDFSIAVDEQVMPYLPHAHSPTLFLETANTQTVPSVLDRIHQLMQFSPHLRYAVALKAYRSPIPMELALVALV